MTDRKFMEFDLPDAYLAGLALSINKKARQGRVTFFSKTNKDVITYMVIFQNGSHRTIVTLNGKPTDGDVDDIVTALESWAGYQVNGSEYTIEVPKAPASEWP